MAYRYAAKVDENQEEIVNALRKIGASVLIISALKNCADIVVGYHGRNFIIEIKRNKKAKLTDGEASFQSKWRGQVATVTNVEEAIDLVTKYRIFEPS